jgi:chromosome segregation ATPase
MNVQLEALTISAFRGIRGRERFEFGGENAVIVGPNGSGKSTILQAIEFLLSGQIAALRGSGTGSIHPTEHIPNQYADPDDTSVKATFRTDAEGPFTLMREFSNRSRLQGLGKLAAARELVTAVEQGLVHLSRDELLELVVATPGDRKAQIYHLMNTTGLDGRRKQLKRLAKRASSAAEDGTTRCREHLQQIQRIAGKNVVDTVDGDLQLRQSGLLEAINARRTQIGGVPLASLSNGTSFQSRIDSPVEQASHPLQRGGVQRRLQAIDAWLTDGLEQTTDALVTLANEIRSLRADEDALEMWQRRSLMQLGLEHVDEDTQACPLCWVPWNRGELASALDARTDRLERIDGRIERIERLATAARNDLESVRTALGRVLEALGDGDSEVDLASLGRLQIALEARIETLTGGLSAELEAIDLDALALPAKAVEQASETVASLQARAAALPDGSRVEVTWGQLQTLEEAYQGFQRATGERRRHARAADELGIAHRAFIESRDAVLTDTFERISGQFAAYYEQVNPDESAFDPSIGQSRTGVDLRVEFYDTGGHPPHAMHSEGHQDLMGVCLFLALATELSPLERLPMLLDDVVMSVDGAHRAQFARLLAGELSGQFQLLATTHDPRWAGELVEAGLVDAERVIRFTDWAPDTGPEITAGLN